MKALSVLLFLATLLTQTSCTLLETRGEIPSMSKINQWLANDEFGRAVSSLEHIPANTPDFTAYISKRKEVKFLAKKYETRVLKQLTEKINRNDSANKISLLDRALEKYPQSNTLRTKQQEILKKHLRSVRRLDAEALLVRAQLLYNKLPLHEQDSRESAMNFSAHFKLQNMRSEIADMHNRLMAMADLLLEDNDLQLTNRCLKQARKFPADQISLNKLKTLQNKVDERLKHISEKRNKRRKKNKSLHSKKLKSDINQAIIDRKLITAGKLLNKLSKLVHDDPTYLKLKLQHREKVSVIVEKKISQGNALYRQEKIYPAKKIWEQALKLDPSNITLQTSILRAKHVLDKLEKLRQLQNNTELN